MNSDSIPYLPNWRGTKMSVSDRIRWNRYDRVPIPSFFFTIQTMEHNFIPFHSISSHQSKHILRSFEEGKCI